jgi:hypothetical protein
VPLVAKADWTDARPLIRQPGFWWEQATWSPDGSHLALTVHKGYPHENDVAVYELATQQTRGLITIGDLVAAVYPFTGDYVTNDSELLLQHDYAQRTILPLGWSADSRHLLLWGQWTTGQLGSPNLNLLAAIAADQFGMLPPEQIPNASSYLVAYGADISLNDIAWSPTDSRKLIFKWHEQEGRRDINTAFLFDLENGPIYFAADVQRAVWSPDGRWIAFLGEEWLTLVGQDGRERASVGLPGGCTDIAWNPAADLSRLENSAVADLYWLETPSPARAVPVRYIQAGSWP